MINDEREAALCETGLGEFLQRIGSFRYGKAEDLRHLAPEYLLLSRNHTPEADMYSFGCLVMRMSLVSEAHQTTDKGLETRGFDT